jgi:hypothetical protein
MWFFSNISIASKSTKVSKDIGLHSTELINTLISQSFHVKTHDTIKIAMGFMHHFLYLANAEAVNKGNDYRLKLNALIRENIANWVKQIVTNSDPVSLASIDSAFMDDNGEYEKDLKRYVQEYKGKAVQTTNANEFFTHEHTSEFISRYLKDAFELNDEQESNYQSLIYSNLRKNI